MTEPTNEKRVDSDGQYARYFAITYIIGLLIYYVFVWGLTSLTGWQNDVNLAFIVVCVAGIFVGHRFVKLEKRTPTDSEKKSLVKICLAVWFVVSSVALFLPMALREAPENSGLSQSAVLFIVAFVTLLYTGFAYVWLRLSFGRLAKSRLIDIQSRQNK